MLIISLIQLLLSNSVSLRRDKSILYSRVTIVILTLSTSIAFKNLNLLFLSRGIGLFGGLFHTTCITNFFHIFIFLISSIILLLTSFYPSKIIGYVSPDIVNETIKNDKLLDKVKYGEWEFTHVECNKEVDSKDEDKKRELPVNLSKILKKIETQYIIIEYSLIILFIIAGALFLICTSDLVSIFLSIELQSYGLYLLSTIYRDSERATSGGLMYFLLGGLSSCFILLSTSLLYSNSGTTGLDSLYIITTIYDVSKDNLLSLFYWYKSYYIHIGLLIMSVGFLFKISAAPFHFWSPDVYDAIPTIVTTFVAIIAKISIFIFLLELVHYTNKSLFDINFSWTMSLVISSLLSLIIGTIVGLTQSRIKRLYAFSTISHLGFILLALTINSIESVQAFIFYLMQYSISNLNAFILIIAIGYSLYFYDYYNKTSEFNSYLGIDHFIHFIYTKNMEDNKNYNNNLQDVKNSPLQLIDQLKGYYFINPILSLSLAITLFSFVGIPPLMGFFAKQMVLSAAVDNGYIFMSLVAIITSVISAVYYLVIIKQIFFDTPDYNLDPKVEDFMKDAFINTSVIKNVKETERVPKIDRYLKKISEKDPLLENIKVNVLSPKDCIYIYSNIAERVVNIENKKYTIRKKDVFVSSSLSLPISVLTIIILLFIFIPQEWLSAANILALILFTV